MGSAGNYMMGMKPNPCTTNLNSIECLSPSTACHTISGLVTHSSSVLRELGACTVLSIFDKEEEIGKGEKRDR